MADVRLTENAARELNDLPLAIHPRIHQLLERLKNWPEVSGARPLRGKLVGHYRLRTGDYRLQFYVESETILVERIGHRDGFYD